MVLLSKIALDTSMKFRSMWLSDPMNELADKARARRSLMAMQLANETSAQNWDDVNN
jgi:hypothetical protein